MTKIFYVVRKGSDVRRVSTYSEVQEYKDKGYTVKTIHRELSIYDTELPGRNSYLNYIKDKADDSKYKTVELDNGYWKRVAI